LPDVSVIIPARDAEATIGRTLSAVQRQEVEGDYEVILVDDGSSDATPEIAKQFDGAVTVLRHEQSRGAGTARNRGADVARGSVLAFTDADCFPTDRWLAEGLHALKQADLVQGAVEPDPEAERSLFDKTLAVDSESGYYQTANMFVRRDLFDKLGGFRDWIVEKGGQGVFGWHASEPGTESRAARQPLGEDVVFGWRARRAGARTAFAANALVYHAVFPQTALEWVGYRWYWRHMPAIAKYVPELRRHLFYRRYFFEQRTARFDAALVGILVAGLARRPLPLVAAVPYAELVVREALKHPGMAAPRFLAGRVAADAVACASLAIGSMAWRSPLL
jgi:glycosyltransferase involved in cell wall biosynthesis